MRGAREDDHEQKLRRPEAGAGRGGDVRAHARGGGAMTDLWDWADVAAVRVIARIYICGVGCISRWLRLPDECVGRFAVEIRATHQIVAAALREAYEAGAVACN